ncbi:MAG: hypothetical protein AAGD10_16420 [Myxococcota bacterium]
MYSVFALATSADRKLVWASKDLDLLRDPDPQEAPFDQVHGIDFRRYGLQRSQSHVGNDDEVTSQLRQDVREMGLDG